MNPTASGTANRLAGAPELASAAPWRAPRHAPTRSCGALCEGLGASSFGIDALFELGVLDLFGHAPGQPVPLGALPSSYPTAVL